MKEMLELPFLCKFSNMSSYYQLEILSKCITDKKNLLKSIKELNNFDDFKSEEEEINDKIRVLFKILDNYTPQVLRVLSAKIDSFHILKELLPNVKNCNKEKLFETIQKISRYKKSDFCEILSYINYKKVQDVILENKNKKEILETIREIKKTIFKRNETILYKKSYGQNYKEILEFKRSSKKNFNTYFNSFVLNGLSITKDPITIDFWGKETHCCLKKGGAAEALIDVMELSPIAGELVGTYYGNKLSSYVWEMVECINGKAYKTLVLDNIESPSVINENTTERLFDDLYKQDKYKTIYLGTVRNDCTINKKYKTKQRQSAIVGFDKELNKSTFTTADSRELYIMRERKEDTKINIRKIEMKDLHNVKYIEKYIYGDIYNGRDDKTDILKQVTLNTPCYIFDSTTNIYGYLLTKWKYFNEYGEEVFNDKGIKKFYIEDLVMSKSKMILLKEVFNEIIEWLKQHKINEVYMNANNNSKNFIKRLEREGIKVIKENMETIQAINYLY